LYVAPTGKNKAYSVASLSGIRGRPEVGTDVSPGAKMVELEQG